MFALHVCRPESFEHLLQVLDVLVKGVEIYNDAIHVDLNTPTDHTSEDLVHKSLVGCSNVFQVKRYDLVVIVGIGRHEGHLLFIPRVHAYLVVARVSIPEAENSMGGCSMHQPVDFGERV